MASNTVLETLRDLEFTHDLEPEHLEKLASMSCEVSFSEGQTLFHEQDVGEFVYLIEEGQIALEIFVPGQGKITILTLGPGQLMGWSSLFPSAHKTASARSVLPTRAIAINAAQLRETIQSDHDLGCIILWRTAGVIANRLKATRMQLLDIFADTASS